MMQYANNIDGRPAFELYCRVPGTRCNAIMAMLDKGIGDEAIANRFHTDVETIHVYRLAHDDKLTTISPYEIEKHMPGERYFIHLINEKIYALHNAGVKPRMIAKMLKLDRDMVRKATKNHKKSRPDD